MGTPNSTDAIHFESALLDTGPEAHFDRITTRTREHVGVASAAITLITEDRQVIKSSTGPVGEDLPRWKAFCAYTIRSDRTGPSLSTPPAITASRITPS